MIEIYDFPDSQPIIREAIIKKNYGKFQDWGRNSNANSIIQKIIEHFWRLFNLFFG